MRTALVVILPPGFDNLDCIVDRLEPVHVQAFISEGSVKRLDIGVVSRFSGPREVYADSMVTGLGVDHINGKFGAIVGKQVFGSTAL